MKKEYCKPIVVFEDFSLSTNIAGDCEHKTNTPSRNQCGLDMSGIMVFLETMQGCIWKVKDVGGDGNYNEICYHVPFGENLFNS